MHNHQPLLPHEAAEAGDYQLLGRLGEGGQGVVYLGRAPSGELVAVKMLHARFSGDTAARDRFLREVAAARSVAEFSTARVLDASTDGDRPFIVSEYVEGVSLDELVKESGPRAPGALERLAVGTMAALAAIHRAGVVHRDFKPSNVLLGLDGPRVIDFGIAKALDATTASASGLIGTPAYMSPEQISGESVGAASDLFTWAVTMVFAATGRPAFGGDSVPAIFHRILTKEPELPELSEPLRGLVASCLAKDPAARPTASEALLILISHHSTPAPPAPAPLPPGDTSPPSTSSPENTSPPGVPSPSAPSPGVPSTGDLFPGVDSPRNESSPESAPAEDVASVRARESVASREGAETAASARANVAVAVPSQVSSPPGSGARTQATGTWRGSHADTHPGARVETRLAPAVPEETPGVPRVRRKRLRPLVMIIVASAALVLSAAVASVAPSLLSAFSSTSGGGSPPMGAAEVPANDPAPVRTSRKPPAKVTLRDLTGLGENKALAVLKKLGLKPRVRRGPDEDVPKGVVISMVPGPGRVAKSDLVTLLISTGPNEREPTQEPSPTTMPEPDEFPVDPEPTEEPTAFPTETPTDGESTPEEEVQVTPTLVPMPEE
ncbi:protein kinase [Nonomuraea sp. NPDC046570]|uniref:protein kinase domain-containing protein n=1 Tax=Nonomuraea sp. NPDC046570 TaxID=3155255 RepID=UPI0033C17869